MTKKKGRGHVMSRGEFITFKKPRKYVGAFELGIIVGGVYTDRLKIQWINPRNGNLRYESYVVKTRLRRLQERDQSDELTAAMVAYKLKNDPV